MQVRILGSGTLVPEAGRATSGLLVRGRGQEIPIDLGRGVLMRMAEAGLEPLELDHFFLTHLHADHSSELVSLLFALPRARRSKAPVHVYGPPGLGDLTDRIFAAWPSMDSAQALEIVESTGGILLDAALRLSARPVHHGQHAALGFRVEDTASGRSMAFTGDSTAGPELLALARGVDLLVAECGDGLEPRGRGHLDAAALVELARTAGVGRVVVTHVEAGTDRAALMRRLREELGESVMEATDSLEIEV
ncbi:hypothetical protein DRQ53_05370 [bacterium]|nr:MAG: hypothetical protein DRQ53_05370 [bacterium]